MNQPSIFLRNSNNFKQLVVNVHEDHLDSWKILDKEVINILDIAQDYGSFDILFEYDPDYLSMLLHAVYHIGSLHAIRNSLSIINK